MMSTKDGQLDFDATQIAAGLNTLGYAPLGELLSLQRAVALQALYQEAKWFRSRVVMQRHGFGSGEYQYFDYPLPEPIATLRDTLYKTLVPVANLWQEQLNAATRFPDQHGDFLTRCHAAGQTRPTPLLLKYRQGDYNCLHQDLYGEHLFPIQVVVLLSAQREFSGGEFVLTEQRPRRQSRATVIPLQTGHGVAFAVNERPQRGTRGYYRVKHRHGVSVLTQGERHTLGIIFHDAD